MADSDDVIPPIPTPPADLGDSPMVPPVETPPTAPTPPYGAPAPAPAPAPVPAESAPPAAPVAPPAPAYGAPAAATPPPAPPAYAAQPAYTAQPGYPAAQPGYAQPAYSQPYTPQPAGPAQGLSITSMVLGILGLLAALVGFGFLPSLAAVITGHMAQRRQPWAKPFWLTGVITGWVGVAIGVVTGLVVLFFVFGVAVFGAYNS
jgi:hypothetical protein